VGRGNSSRIGTLTLNEKNVAPRIPVKPGHDGEIEFESLALTTFESFHQPCKCGLAERFGLIGVLVAPPNGGERPRLGGRPVRLGIGPVQLRELPDTSFGDGLFGFAFLGGRVLASLDVAFV